MEAPTSETGSAVRESGRPGAARTGLLSFRVSPMALVIGGTAVALVLLIAYPVGWLIVKSLTSDVDDSVGVANYIQVFTDPAMYTAVLNTLIIAAGATLISVVAGV